jgi:hypothetical protein
LQVSYTAEKLDSEINTVEVFETFWEQVKYFDLPHDDTHNSVQADAHVFILHAKPSTAFEMGLLVNTSIECFFLVHPSS